MYFLNFRINLIKKEYKIYFVGYSWLQFCELTSGPAWPYCGVLILVAILNFCLLLHVPVANLVVGTQYFLASKMLLTYWQAQTSLKKGLQERVWLAGEGCSLQKMKAAFLKIFINSRLGLLLRILMYCSWSSLTFDLLINQSLSLPLKRLQFTVQSAKYCRQV